MCGGPIRGRRLHVLYNLKRFNYLPAAAQSSALVCGSAEAWTLI